MVLIGRELRVRSQLALRGLLSNIGVQQLSKPQEEASLVEDLNSVFAGNSCQTFFNRLVTNCADLKGT